MTLLYHFYYQQKLFWITVLILSTKQFLVPCTRIWTHFGLMKYLLKPYEIYFHILKTYHIIEYDKDNNHVKLKQSAKGVPMKIAEEVDHSSYLDCLYNDENCTSHFNALQYIPKLNNVCLIQTKKKCLTIIYTKHYVCRDRITVVPHKIDSKYI